jgi:PPOX class probable F420-dependent enzyme
VAVDADAMTLDPALVAILTGSNLGTLATIRRDGRPQLSNINYCFDPEQGLIRVSLTDGRAKVANMRRDARATLLVNASSGWHFAVADATVELSAVAAAPDDAAVEELIEVYRLVSGQEHPDWDDYRRAMVEDRRLVGRLNVTHLYGKAD